jgi:hypothetical protein
MSDKRINLIYLSNLALKHQVNHHKKFVLYQVNIMQVLTIQ